MSTRPSYFSWWLILSAASPLILLVVFVVTFAHVHPTRWSCADVVIDYTYECSARTTSSLEPLRRWTERCRIGPTPPEPSIEALLALTTECNVTTMIPVSRSVSGFSVDCVKQGEPVMLTTERPLKSALTGFAMFFFSSYVVQLCMLFATARNVWALWQSVTEYARKNVAFCPLETLLKCQRQYPEALSQLHLTNLPDSSSSSSGAEWKKCLINYETPSSDNSAISTTETFSVEQFEASLRKHQQVQLELRKSCLFVLPVAFFLCLMCTLYFVFLQIHWSTDAVLIISNLVIFVGMCVPTLRTN